MRQADICHARTCNTHDDTVPSQNGMHKLRYARGRNRATEFCSELNTARTHTHQTPCTQGLVRSLESALCPVAQPRVNTGTHKHTRNDNKKPFFVINQPNYAGYMYIHIHNTGERVHSMHIRWCTCTLCIYLYCLFVFVFVHLLATKPKMLYVRTIFFCVVLCSAAAAHSVPWVLLWFCLDYRVYCAYTAFVVRQNKNASDDFEEPLHPLLTISGAAS